MKIVTTTCVFPPLSDLFSIIERLARIGFDTLDIAFDYCVDSADYPFMTSGYEDWAHRLREHAERHNVRITHSHAPFDADGRGDLVERTMRCAEILGIKYTVVHPLWRKADNVFYEGEEFLELNSREILPILDAAGQHGITVLSENLLWGASIQPKAISDLVAAVNAPNFGWCYDSGHANCFGIRPNALLGLIPPLSLHLQDNHGVPMQDEHLIPGDGTVDWNEMMHTLLAIGYTGDLVLEAHHQSLDASDRERDVILRRLLFSAKNLLKLI